MAMRVQDLNQIQPIQGRPKPGIGGVCCSTVYKVRIYSPAFMIHQPALLSISGSFAVAVVPSPWEPDRCTPSLSDISFP